MGRKKLPDPSEKNRPYWGFVEMVTTNAEDVKNALKGGTNLKKHLTLNVRVHSLFK